MASSDGVVGILRVLLGLNTAQFEAGAKRAGTQALTLAKDLGGIGRAATKIGASLTATLTVPLVAAGAMALSTGLQFESVMNSIQGVLQPTAAQMESVRATAVRMGADTAFSARDAGEAILELGKAGLDTDTAIRSVDEVLQLAAASGMGMADSASLAARSLNAFGLKAADLGHVNDVLAKAVNSSSLEIQDLQVAFGYVGPIARGFGMSIEEVSAALGIMRDSGIAAETTGRALREGFSRLANPVKSVREVMEELGISSFTSNGKLLGLTQVVGLLQAKGLTAAQSLKLFGDAAGPGMFALVQQGQQGLIDLTNELRNSDGAAKAMADAMMTGLPGAMERLRGSVETAWLSISRAIEPAAVRIADAAGGLADLVTTRLAPAFMALPVPVQMTALGLTGLAAVAGPVIFGFGQVAIAASAVIGAFGSAGLATKALQGGMAVFATQLPTFSAALTAVWSTMAIGSTTAGVLAGALQGLAMWVAAAGAAFVGWQIGTFIGEVTGATDAVGKLTAKLGEMVGLLPQGAAAQYEASQAAKRAAEAAKATGQSFDEVGAAAKALKDRISGEGLARDMATLEGEVNRLNASGGLTPGVMKRIQGEVLSLQTRGAELSGVLADIASAAAATVPALDAAGESSSKSAKAAEDAATKYREFNNWLGERQMEAAATAIKAQEDFAASATRTIAVFSPYQAAVASTADEVRRLGGSLSDLASGSLLEYGTATTKARDEALAWAQANGAVLAPSIRQVTAASLVAATETVSVWGQTMASLPGVILGAIQGGGSVIAAAGAHIGQSMMAAFAEKFGPAIKAALPFGIGNAVTTLLPLIGSLFGPVAKKIGDFFRNIFGGPGGDELAGRSHVAAFEGELHDALSAQQELESQGEDWRRTVIAIRDAYIAAGRTEAEALRDAERLWESSKQGAEASLRVIEEIRRKMQQLTSEDHTVSIDVEVRVPEGAPSAGDIEDVIRRGDYSRLPVEPGFANGTLGRFGTWFTNFGAAGFDTTLHGVEAILRPDQAIPFAADILDRIGPLDLSGVTTTNTTNQSVVVTPIVMGGPDADPYSLTREVVRSLPSSLALDEAGLTTAIEHVINNWFLSYGQRG